MKQILLMIVAVVLVGCGSAISNNNANLSKLSVGMTKAQVLEIMGTSRKTEAYETRTGGSMEFLFYQSQSTFQPWVGHERISDRHWTPVCIIDGKLKGWGRNFYDNTIKIRKEIIRE